MTFLPFSYNWIVRKNLEKLNPKKIVDLGCGDGTFGLRFNKRRQYNVTGVDIFEPYLKKCLDTGNYNEAMKADLRKKLKFPDKKFDGVVCLETIEHLKKSDGANLLNEMERLAKKIIILSCPMGIAAQEAYDKNIYQQHKSSWYPKDFKKKGYKVYGIGLKFVFGNKTHIKYKLTPLILPLAFLSFLFNPLTNYFPNIACQVVAVKLLKT